MLILSLKAMLLLPEEMLVPKAVLDLLPEVVLVALKVMLDLLLDVFLEVYLLLLEVAVFLEVVFEVTLVHLEVPLLLNCKEEILSMLPEEINMRWP